MSPVTVYQLLPDFDRVKDHMTYPMLHQKIPDFLAARMEDRHLRKISDEAERAIINGDPFKKLEISAQEIMSLLGEVREYRASKAPPGVPDGPDVGVYVSKHPFFSGARCTNCKGNIVYFKGKRRPKISDNTCKCDDGKESPGEPYGTCPDPNPECNCGVSMGLRSDHESQCAAAYLHGGR